MPKIALLFPGQGSQSVGMGKGLAEAYPVAKQVINEIDNILNLSPTLSQVMFEGPEETLKRTLYTQPGIYAVSMAALAVLKSQVEIEPVMAAGHSLGEYGALVSAGVIDNETGAKLIARRASLMEAAPPGAMAAILGLEISKVEEAVKAGQAQGIVTVANYNTPEQTVISGDPAAVTAAAEAAKTLGAMKAVMLPVGGAFHSPLMAEADRSFADYVKDFTFNNAAFPVITNVDAHSTTDATAFQSKLAQQISHSVRWVETLNEMRNAGVDTFIEIGPGKVLTGMMKRSFRDAKLLNIYDAESLENTVAALKANLIQV